MYYIGIVRLGEQPQVILQMTAGLKNVTVSLLSGACYVCQLTQLDTVFLTRPLLGEQLVSFGERNLFSSLANF